MPYKVLRLAQNDPSERQLGMLRGVLGYDVEIVTTHEAPKKKSTDRMLELIDKFDPDVIELKALPSVTRLIMGRVFVPVIQELWVDGEFSHYGWMTEPMGPYIPITDSEFMEAVEGEEE